jgi:hypothetical protein
LRAIRIRLAWLQVAQMATVAPGYRAMRDRCPRGGPASSSRRLLSGLKSSAVVQPILIFESNPVHHEPDMAPCFTPTNTPIRGLEMWQANGIEYSFAISRESRQGSSDKPAFVASWRSRYNNKPAITVVGSPFATLVEAEYACEAMLMHLSRRVI